MWHVRTYLYNVDIYVPNIFMWVLDIVIIKCLPFNSLFFFPLTLLLMMMEWNHWSRRCSRVCQKWQIVLSKSQSRLKTCVQCLTVHWGIGGKRRTFGPMGKRHSLVDMLWKASSQRPADTINHECYKKNIETAESYFMIYFHF